MLLVDFKNAFNLVDMSVLFEETRTINQSCKLTLQAWYLDNDTIVGDTLLVGKALDIINTNGLNRGLFLNVDKTELFWPVEDPRISLEEGFYRDLALKRVSKTISLMEAIYKLHDPQCELLLRNCAGVAKLSYALRTGDIIQYAFLASRLQTSTLEAKILMKTGIESHGSSFQHALDAFNTTCNVNVLSVTTFTSAPQMMKTLAKCYFGVIEKDLVFKLAVPMFSEGGIMVRKKAPMGFLSDDGKDLRPADLLLFNWLQGKDAYLDVTCISPFVDIGATSWAHGVALNNDVEKKKRKYASICEENGYKFIPFSFFTFGEFDTEALDTL
nr:putative reverse transcriptase domain-containing protein [Tanacetum cinerariifolium]